MKRSIILSFIILVSLFLAGGSTGYAQLADAWYNADSLLAKLGKNKKMHELIEEADDVYTHAHIDTADISPNAFRFAWLEKKLIDGRQLNIPLRAKYKKTHILSVVDFTRQGNARRFLTIDVVKRRILFDTLVTQGYGTGANSNDKYCLPVYFSNAANSQCSSPGMILATKGTHPDNPCHLCKYTLSQKHDCVVVLEGLEQDVNNNVLARDVVIHTTGSLSFGTDALRRKLHISDAKYRVVPEACECCSSNSDGVEKATSTYASACGIAENGGYMGQSNGCLVLPEDNHIGQMQTVKNGSLIFIYTNAITAQSNYFKDSPLVRRMIKMIH